MDQIEKTYNSLVQAGTRVQREHPEINQDPEVVLDVASRVCLRLLEGEDVKIRSPLGYMRNALYYSNKALWHDSFDDELYTAQEEHRDYGAYVEELMQGAQVDLSTEVGQLIKETLLLRLKWVKIAAKLSPDVRQVYCEKMEEIRSHVKKNLQGSRLLPSG